MATLNGCLCVGPPYQLWVVTPCPAANTVSQHCHQGTVWPHTTCAVLSTEHGICALRTALCVACRKFTDNRNVSGASEQMHPLKELAEPEQVGTETSD